MKLSHEKIVHISHLLVDVLEGDETVTFHKARNEVRLEIVEAVRRELQVEEDMEERARTRISSQKRNIAEGSQEWEILFRKYYDEERDKRRRIR